MCVLWVTERGYKMHDGNEATSRDGLLLSRLGWTPPSAAGLPPPRLGWTSPSAAWLRLGWPSPSAVGIDLPFRSWTFLAGSDVRTTMVINDVCSAFVLSRAHKLQKNLGEANYHSEASLVLVNLSHSWRVLLYVVNGCRSRAYSVLGNMKHFARERSEMCVAKGLVSAIARRTAAARHGYANICNGALLSSAASTVGRWVMYTVQKSDPVLLKG
ncbi:hypothetical protein Tco_1294361 [Tanacetum coccineum]